MYCRKCGTESEKTSTFCLHCGALLSASAGDTEAHEELSRSIATPGVHSSPASAAEQPPQASEDASSAKPNHGAAHSINPFSGFYPSRGETSVLSKLFFVALGIVAILGVTGVTAFYFSQRNDEIAEITKLPASAPTAKPSETSKTDFIFPCPSEMPFCIGAAASKIKDPTCNEDKPVWAHYSEDDGVTWKRAGCYATEAEARQGLSNILGIATPDVQKSTVAVQKAPETKREKPAVRQNHLHSVAPPTPEDNDSPKKYHANFKGPFGIIVEKRTYPTEEMKKKALALWGSERKILELDGSINDKYVLRQPQTSGPIPGH